MINKILLLFFGYAIVDKKTYENGKKYGKLLKESLELMNRYQILKSSYIDQINNPLDVIEDYRTKKNDNL